MSSAGILPGPAPTRRRGDALLAAIYAAVLEELAATGYGALSIERVADRARTGKASIYRRWPSRLELVLDALDHTLPSMDDLPNTGRIRDDLLILLRRIAAAMSSREGDAARACFGPGVDNELSEAIRERLLAPRKAAFQTLLRRAADGGDISPAAVTPRIAETGPMLLYGELLQRGAITDEAVVEIVDEVLLPLLRAPR